MKTPIQTTLDENIPKDAVSTREGGGSKSLSYLEAWYVIDRLNQVLGQGDWSYQVSNLNKVFEGTVKQTSWIDGKKTLVDAFATSYTAIVTMYAKIDGKTVVFSEVGYGDGTDKMSPGKAHELATKEAVSDAVKRAAKNLGRSMGLALYDKTQEFVGTQVSNDSVRAAPHGIGESAKVDDRQPATVQKTGSGAIPKPVKETVIAAAKILDAQKKITLDAFKVKYQKNVGISKLTDEQLTGILKEVKQDFPHLNLGA